MSTRIAAWIRNQVLEDGSRPLGIEFGSKHGGGRCWAYWMRRSDDGLGDDLASTDPGIPIQRDRTALAVVATRFGLTLW